MFIKDQIYIIKAAGQAYLAKAAGINETARPFIQFTEVMAIDDSRYTHFIKTGSLGSKDLKGAFAFKTDFWLQERYISQAIKIAVQPPTNLEVIKNE